MKAKSTQTKLKLCVGVSARYGGSRITAIVGDWQYYCNVRGNSKQWNLADAEKFVRSNPGSFVSESTEAPPLADIVGIV